MKEDIRALPDVYFARAYCELYESIEKGTVNKFEYADENGAASNIFMKRPVPYTVDGEQYYDIVTPYGYGGPVVTEAKDKEALLEGYWRAWTEYCEKERIVCEFVRFHPLLRNDVDFGSRYNAVKNRHTLAIELTEDFFATQFSSKCRNTIRKAEKLGVTYEIDEACDSIETFAEIYYKTMAKDNADDYYFFALDYFLKMREELAGSLVLINAKLEGKTIASSLFMLSEEFMHYHLSATDPEYYTYAANNLVLKVAAEWGCTHGKKWLHLGGGLSSSEEDSLFKFKRSFAREDRNLKEFWLGKALYNKEVYDKLVDIRRAEGNFDEESGFFPKYRI